MDPQFDYYRIINGYALLAQEVGDTARAAEILRAGSRGEAIPEDPQRRTLDYCLYRQGWPLTETVSRG